MRQVLDDGSLLYVAVAGRSGPRVTPTLFTVERDQIWFVVARGSLKARVIARDGRVGAMIRSGDRAVVVQGRARVVDALTLRGMGSPDRLLDLPLAAAGFVGRNLRDTTGVMRGRPVPTLPLSRVGVELEVHAGVLLEDERVVARWGTWPDREPPGDLHLEPSVIDLSGVPEDLHGLLTPRAPVVLGWESAAGPIALPGRWQGDHLETSATTLRLAGSPASGPACVTAARSGRRLSQKQGVMLTGYGRATRAAVAIDATGVTWWRGDEIRSSPVKV